MDDLSAMAAGPGLENSAAMGPRRLVGVQVPFDWPPICGETGSAALGYMPTEGQHKTYTMLFFNLITLNTTSYNALT